MIFLQMFSWIENWVKAGGKKCRSFLREFWAIKSNHFSGPGRPSPDPACPGGHQMAQPALEGKLRIKTWRFRKSPKIPLLPMYWSLPSFLVDKRVSSSAHVS
ncbi:hypothetical protein PoB_006682600 [Plakobranchus ocellatus]|uniref:Uncharacterized protein n=1 Tax=Plakobranchus ocellatus TaxID=259542 RepID=A0AAV4D8Q6_9GAST|nr:hypothetical protein PoB_006682600 [Plakobranchus ocellatus]